MTDDDGFDVRSLAVTYRDGHHIGTHRHPWAQLIYAKAGMMHVVTDSLVWVVPSTRAVWIPHGVTHEIVVKGEVAMRTLYLNPIRSACVARGLEALEVGPLLRELIVHIVALGMLDPHRDEHNRLAGVLVDLVAAAPRTDLALPLPRDSRALKLALHLRTHAADKRDLQILAQESGASLRTLQRYFAGETGMTIEQWRQKARLVHSAAALTRRVSVTTAALDCGYDSASAYIAAFRRHFGVTPGRFDRG